MPRPLPYAPNTSGRSILRALSTSSFHATPVTCKMLPSSTTPRHTRTAHAALATLTAAASLVMITACSSGQADTSTPPQNTASSPSTPSPRAGKPALSVNTTAVRSDSWPLQLSANGNVAAWQEAVIGSEANGLRITQVKANIGDTVKRGDVLLTMEAATVKADLAATQAALAEAEAALADASANAERARQLQATGAISAQQIQQYLTVQSTTAARVQAQKARLEVDRLRLKQTQILAPDDGIISARQATVGTVVGTGQELFRFIRQGRLEWRAELPAQDLPRVQPGQAVKLNLGDDQTVQGTVRQVAPTVDAATRNGLVYVDLQASTAVRAGVFARGTVDIGTASALTLPQTAVALRDGYHYAYRVDDRQQVTQTKINVGRRVGDRIEIVSGLKTGEPVVASGVSFLADGDTVKVLDAPATATASHTAASSATSPTAQ